MPAARYAFTVASNCPVLMGGLVDERADLARFPPGTETAATLELSGADPHPSPLARVHTPRTDERWSLRSPAPFWIHDANGGPLCSLRPVAANVFEVSGADNAPLVRMTYRPGRVLPWPRRPRWTVAACDGPSPEITGRAGTWYAWLAYVLTFPAWLVIALVTLVYALLDGDPADKVYRVAPRHIDIRIAYPLAVLHDWSGRSRT